ncbi:MAG: TIGR01777 family oxidoreductase [Pseudomonadota bacterium]|nr:TIGR01777 family oxidoreductase [Pseudomonadota bacterium]
MPLPSQNFERRTPMPVSPEELYAWHEREGALQRLLPPFDNAQVVETSGSFADRRVVMRINVLGPVWQTLIARHRLAVPGVRFQDGQEQGPFARWEHTHEFLPAPGGSELLDRIEYALPLGVLGQTFGGAFARARIERMFQFRHQRTREDLARHTGFPMKSLRVAVTGASGLIGTQLCSFLTTGGHTVDRLVRRDAGPGEIKWDPARRTLDARALEGVDVVVHLAGENVGGGRWTVARKSEVMKSRVDGTHTIATAVASLDKKPLLISASAVGYYGNTGDSVADETTPNGTGFLAEVCKAWEASADPARAAGVRVVHPRLGVVLSGAGGALAQMKAPFLLGVGGPIGDGRQWFPWIAMDDAVGALHHLMAAGLEGPVNLVAPASVRQAEFAKVLGKVLGRPAILPLPAFAVRALFGEMGQGILLDGQRVAARRLLESGYRFVREDLEAALRFELGR